MLALGQSASVNLRVPSIGKGARLPTTALLGEGQTTRVWVFDEKTETVKAHPVMLAGIERWGPEATFARLWGIWPLLTKAFALSVPKDAGVAQG